MQKNRKVMGMHCIIHREALAAKTMSQSLKQALDCAIKVVNYMKASALNTRLFRKLCQDMDAEYDSLLFHTLAIKRKYVDSACAFITTRY